MSDKILKRANELKERWTREIMGNVAPSSVNTNSTNATFPFVSSQWSRQGNGFLKIPHEPSMGNHTQTSSLLKQNAQSSQSHANQLGSHDSHNSPITSNNMEALLGSTREIFLSCLDGFLQDFQNSNVQNEVQALLMNTALIKIVCKSDKNDGSDHRKMFAEFSKSLDDFKKPSNGCGPSSTITTITTSSQQTIFGSECNPTEFEMAAFHSTQRGNNLEEPKSRVERHANNPPSSLSSEPKSSLFQRMYQSKFGNNERNNLEEPKSRVERHANNPPSSLSSEPKSSLFQRMYQSKIGNNERGTTSNPYASVLKNYTSIPSDQLFDESSANDNDSFSPDLSQSRIARSRAGTNASTINLAKIKDGNSRKLNPSMSVSCTPITNWYINVLSGDKVELCGYDTNNNFGSHGVVCCRRDKNMVKTNKGLYKLVGPMKHVRALPPQVRKLFRNEFPCAWKKILKDCGVFK